MKFAVRCFDFLSSFSRRDSRLRALECWALALTLPICSLLISMALWNILYPAIFILFFAAVAVAAVTGGFAYGMLAAVESAVLGNYFLLLPKRTFTHDAETAFRTLLFLISCALISYVGEKQLRARRLLRRMHSDLLAEHERVELALSAGRAFAWHHDAKTHKVTCKGNLEVVEALGFPVSSDEWMNAIHPDDRPQVREAFSLALSKGQPYEIEYRLVVGERTFWLLTCGKGIAGTDGKIARIVGVSVDNTHEKRMQAVLAKSERFAVAGRLAATVAHEIRDPLETIGNVVFLLRKSGRLSAEEVEMLNVITCEVDRIDGIARNTLALHRSSQSISEFKVCEAVQLVTEFYRKKFDARKVELKKTGWTYDATMTGNIGELRQIVSNLLGNALDAVEEGAAIAVRVRSHGRGAMRRIRISVADNGCGIPSSARSAVFKPFFTTKEESGTGLGLWVTKQLVERAGGHIRMRSATTGPRVGTTFRVVLPATLRLS